MTITSKTLYADFEQYESVLTEESVQELKQAAQEFFKPCHLLTIDEFWGLLHKDFQLLGDVTNPTVLQVYWCKAWGSFLEQFTKTCEKLSLKDPESDAIQSGCVQMQPQENMLIFVREYFGLKSFTEAGHVTIGEYVLARKDHYNQNKMRKNYEALQLKKIKNKSK